MVQRSYSLLLLVALLLAGFVPFHTAWAQEASIETSLEYQFGRQIIFQAQVQAGVPVEAAMLFIQVEGESDTREVAVPVNPDGSLSYPLDVTQQPVRAFSNITFWFEVQLQGDEKLASQKSTFFYEDNRFNWQVRVAQPFHVHWYQGDADFSQNVLDVVQAGLQRVQNLLPLQVPEGIDIYAYATAAEMQGTLNLASQDWVAAGHADPDLGIIVVALPAGPDQRLLMEQRIPHELMHILLYQKMGTAYSNLPTWLNEGLASNAELYPNSEYLFLLDNAQRTDGLLPLVSLCRTFPRDVSSALLAYAQSTSFTRFLHQRFGTAGLDRLVSHYEEGIACERGVQLAFGESLPDLEKRWRQEAFGENVVVTALRRLAPWLVLLAVVLAIPLGLTLGSLLRQPAKQERNNPSS